MIYYQGWSDTAAWMLYLKAYSFVMDIFHNYSVVNWNVSALNSTTKSTSEVGDLVKECNDPKRKNLGSIGSLRTDRATGIFVHRGMFNIQLNCDMGE